MKTLRYILLIVLFSISIIGNSQDTIKYLQGYEEIFLPPEGNSTQTDSLFNRHLIFKTDDLEKLDSIVFLYYSDREVIFESSQTYPDLEGKVMLKAGKTLALNNYTMIIYPKAGNANPFNTGLTRQELFDIQPVQYATDTIVPEEELYIPLEE